MSFTFCPPRSVLLHESVTAFSPVYKPSFVYHGMPSTLLTLSHELGRSPHLIHLNSGYTEADSVLGNMSEQRPVAIASIALPLDPDQEWLTLLDVVPAKLVYAAVSKQGKLAFIQLSVTLGNTFTTALLHIVDFVPVKKMVSLCFEGRRYFLVEDTNEELEFYVCDLSKETYPVTAVPLQEEERLAKLMLQDYNTENNIIGCKHNVCFYDGVPIARVPRGHRFLAVFGTRCEEFQLLVLNRATRATEWWRWTGRECEAVSLTGSESFHIHGNLLWV